MSAQNLFSSVGQNRIFRNRSVLVSDFIPLSLPHRESEIRRLAQILSPSLEGTRPNNAFMYGLTGTGKTAVVRYVSNQLSKEALSRGAAVGLVYVNARKDDTSYRVLAQVGKQLNLHLPFTGLSVAEVYSRVTAHVEKLSCTVIVSIDEIDSLVREPNGNLLYKLTRMNSDLSKSRVSLIGITNDSKVLDVLDPRVRSSLGEEELIFGPYDAEQLRDILHARSSDAFQDNALGADVIPYVAALAAKDHGDARKAVDLLRKAGEVAERLGSERVRTEHVQQALSEIEVDTALEVVTKLPLHSKIILACVADLYVKKQTVITGDVFALYLHTCKRMGLEVLTSRRVSEIINELDMVGVISTRILNRGRFGRTKRIALNVDPEHVRAAISKDDILKTT